MIAVFQLISIGWALLTGPLALILLFVAVTWDGRSFAVAGLLWSLAPLVALIGNSAKRRQRRPVALAMVGVAAVLTSVLLWRAPSGERGPDAKARHLYADGKTGFRRFALGNLLPEVDQFMLGLTLVPFVDSIFTHRQSVEMKRLTADVYRELERDPDFHDLGSVMPDVYAEFWNGEFDRGHSFLYVPPAADRSKPLPALVFLHGSGGSFKAYLWLLSRLADRLNFVVIAPSYGMGNWSNTDVEQLVKTTLSTSSSRVTLDRGNLHVLGLSNGGLAVSQLLPAREISFRSFLFLSPVFDEERIAALRHWDPSRKPSVFILTGRLDDRVTVTYVRRMAQQLSARGANLTLEELDRADHFAFFSHREPVLQALEAWLRKNGLNP